jgi:hypothetical protein
MNSELVMIWTEAVMMHFCPNRLCLERLWKATKTAGKTAGLQVCVSNWNVTNVKQKPCHSSGGYSPASHRGGQGWSPGQVVWDLWWAKWH